MKSKLNRFSVLTTAQTHCAFSQKIAQLSNIFSSTFMRAGEAVQGPLVVYNGVLNLQPMYNTARSVELDSRYKHVYSKDKTGHTFFEIPTEMTGGERRVVVEI